VERFAALRPRARGSANIEPFDYRLNTYRYMKTVAEAGCARGKLDIGMEDTAAKKDPSKRQATARGLAADRTHMSRLWEQAIILDRSSPSAVAVHWRRLAKGAHRRIELRNIGRATLEAKLPPASGSFEYHITAQSSTGKLVWPTTAPTTSQTVVVW